MGQCTAGASFSFPTAILFTLQFSAGMNSIWVFLSCVTYLFLASADLILDTNSGPVRGTHALSEDVDAFLGIPFAEPPVGELRFSKPIPKAPWTEIYNATHFSPPCVQYTLGTYYFLPDTSNMSEDCLYLNVWAPRAKYVQALRPVVIFIHGGAFSMGSASIQIHDGSKLASRGDIVVATINYRLGALGFFLGNTEEAPGNMGLYDQILAIKWIKDNARTFGGHPDNIVLMGQSAGAYSISMMAVSPLSRNLFKSAILESGSGINPYISDNNTRLAKNSHIVSSVLGCANETVNLKTNPQAVVRCLKLQAKEDFARAEKLLLKSNAVIFYPRVYDEVLPNPVVDLYREGKFRTDLKVLAGITRDEGTLMTVIAIPEYLGYYGRDPPETMTKFGAISWLRTELILMGQKNHSEIIDFYLSVVKNRTSLGFVKMLSEPVGDVVGGCSPLFLGDFVSLKGNPVYFYKFGFRAASTPMAEWVGVTHGDEVQYVFGNPFHDNFTAEEIRTSNLIMDRWSAFARTGNPNLPKHIPWLRYGYHNRMYLDFGQEEESIRMDPNPRCEVWRKRFGADIDQ